MLLKTFSLQALATAEGAANAGSGGLAGSLLIGALGAGGGFLQGSKRQRRKYERGEG